MRLELRAVAGLAGVLLFVIGVVLLVVGAIATATADHAPLFVMLAVLGLLFILASAVLCTFASRTASAVAGGALSVIALLTGVGLILLGFVFRESASSAFNHDRAAAVAWVLGAGMLVLGGPALALVIWWSNTNNGRRQMHGATRVLAFCYGAALFFQGLSLLASLPFSAAVAQGMRQGQTVHTVVVGTTLAGGALLALFPGIVFIYHGISSFMHLPSQRLRLPSERLLALVFFLSILVGAGLLAANLATGVALPPLHVLAAISAPLAIIALATRRARAPSAVESTRVTSRQVMGMMAWGMAVAASIALTLELLSFLYTILAFLIVNQHLSQMQDMHQLMNTVGSSSNDIDKKVRLLFLLVVIALLGPLIEEFSKGFGVRFLRGDRPSRYQAFVFGLAAGAGFATVEAVEYGSAALGQDLHRWWDTMLLRGGAGSLHALASGIVGLAWYQAFNGRRLQGSLLFLIAFGLHSSWNALNVLTVARIVPYFKDLTDRTLEIGLDVVLGLAAIGLIAGIAALSRLLAREEEEGVQLTSGALATLILPIQPELLRTSPSLDTQQLSPIRPRTNPSLDTQRLAAVRPVPALPADDGLAEPAPRTEPPEISS